MSEVEEQPSLDTFKKRVRNTGLKTWLEFKLQSTCYCRVITLTRRGEKITASPQLD